MEARRDAFRAISDPTRRQIIGILADKSLNLTAISSKIKYEKDKDILLDLALNIFISFLLLMA